MSDLSHVKEDIKRMVREQRARLDPDLLDAMKKIIEGQTPNEQSQEVPYDKEAATQVIKLFLKNHKNPTKFERDLIQRLKQKK